MSGLENIADKEYLGRIIIVGRASNGDDVVVYAVTGRSEPSRARELIANNELEVGAMRTNPTDPKALEEGIEPLLIYNFLRRYNENLIVSNGAQTDLIFETMQNLRARGREINPVGFLVEAFRKPVLVKGNKKVPLINLTSYEPDTPNWTPRISAVLTRDGAAMSIVRWCEGVPIKSFFEIPLFNGKGKVLSTYTGKNVPKGDVLPSFRGEPFDVAIVGETPEQVARAVYEALGPKSGEGILEPGKDFRVGVAALFYQRRPYPKIETYIAKREK